VSPRAVLDAVVKRKIPSPCRESNPRTQIVQSLYRGYIDIKNHELLNTVIRRPFEKFVDSPYYSESEICGGAVIVSFPKYLLWQAMNFLQRSTHFSKTRWRPFSESFRRIVEHAVFLPRSPLFMLGKAKSGLHRFDG
jgi:hypothetical protein